MEDFEVADVVVAPASVSEVQQIVSLCAELKYSVVARGAAMSYTRAHTPTTERTAMLDMRRMSGVRSINVRDRYVIAEPGCTWERLLLELTDHQVRTPFWGTLSGRRATIGGTISQNGVFYGSALHGTAADMVLGLEVVLADGSLVHTGSWAKRGSAPFSRFFGPDLTGLFLCDSGSMGVKTAISLKLEPKPGGVTAATFLCRDQDEALQCMEELVTAQIASDVFAFNPQYHRMLNRLGFTELDPDGWSVHVIVEGPSQRAASAAAQDLYRVVTVPAKRREGTVPMALRVDPFGATQTIFANEERAVHLPVHGNVPFSSARAGMAAVDAVLDSRAADLSAGGVHLWKLLSVAQNSLIIEATVYFSGEYRDRTVNSRAVALAKEIRWQLVEALDSVGATHHQVGKYYRGASSLDETAQTVLRGVKRTLDPDRLLNPGAIEL
jgi:D-lactate dehydrogenase (cytochrome)